MLWVLLGCRDLPLLLLLLLALLLLLLWGLLLGAGPSAQLFHCGKGALACLGKLPR